jgi:hypothetical protein
LSIGSRRQKDNSDGLRTRDSGGGCTNHEAMGADTALIIYDGECVFCNNYVRFVRLRETIGKVALLDARSNDSRVERYWNDGHDLNEGMIFAWQDLPRLRGGARTRSPVERKFGSELAQPGHLLEPRCVRGPLPVSKRLDVA